MSSFPFFRHLRHHGWRAWSAGLAAVAAIATQAATSSSDLPQAPGYYRQAIGDVRVTALFDGVVPLGRNQLVGIDKARVDALMADSYVPENAQGMQTAVNAYLVQRGNQLMLVDAGTAKCFGDTLGQVLENLRQSGYKPEDVDAVLLTHAHPDHLCGVLDAKGAMAFPNATLWLTASEAEYWQDARTERNATEAERPLFAMAQRALSPYVAAGKLRRFGAGDTLPGGIVALPSPGHTPGHTSYLVDGGAGQKLLVWGDVLHYHAVQFAEPEASFEVDTDRARAIRSRKELLAQATREKWWVAGAHLPFPGFGHVRIQGKAFAWVPVEFSPLPAKR